MCTGSTVCNLLLFFGLRTEQSSSIPSTLYEFPNGYNINLTIEKFKLTEGLFNASNLSGISGGDLLSIPNIVINSASMCDVDIRPVSWLRNCCLWSKRRKRSL